MSRRSRRWRRARLRSTCPRRAFDKAALEPIAREADDCPNHDLLPLLGDAAYLLCLSGDAGAAALAERLAALLGAVAETRAASGLIARATLGRTRSTG